MKKMSLILMFFLAYPFAGYARWPNFTFPSKEYLINTGVIDQSQCPKGYGKINANISFPVSTFTKSFCPANWTWVSCGSQCFDLNDFNFKFFNIEYVRDVHGTTIKSTVTAFYGSHNSPLVSFIFSSPEEYWHCYEMNTEMHIISCANDI